MPDPDPSRGGRLTGVDHCDPAAYGDTFADVYDDWYADVTDAGATARTIGDLAAGRRVLELGVGTGRLAGPLARRGVDLVGLDASAAMLQRLRGRLRHLPAVRADMACLPFASGSFGLVLCAYNTLFNLVAPASGPATEVQARAIREAARVLVPGGVLVVETWIPPTDPPADGVSARRHDGTLVVTVTRTDAARGEIEGRHLELRPQGLVARPWRIRPVPPPQIDALAASAGLRRLMVWGDWSRRPARDDDETRIAVYGRSGS